ncbi:MAG TPA: NUDIX domain-containing protein, partial [Anaeromyxobacteraceae bacterium]|nr:NUDIX domain-containing protein [Anaeromyxobacteraceae bacterium]
RPRRRPAARTARLLLARVERGGRILLARSPEGGLFPGMWGLPAVEVDADGRGGVEGGSPAGVLERGARRELGLRLRVGEEVASLTRVLTHRILELHVHRAELREGGRLDPARLRFTTEGDASRLPASTAMRRVIEASGGWRSGSRGTRDTKNVSGESRKALTSRGRTV